MAKLIWAIISGSLAVICLVISIRQFKEKGVPFNNAYIWATKEERETMDKKPHYRQSGIAFAGTTAAFFFMALACVFESTWLWLAVELSAVAVLIYAIASSVREMKK